MTVPKPAKQPADAGEFVGFPAAPVFTERSAWSAIGEGWRHLHGSVRGAGVSFEWHDFKTHTEFDWGKSFHPGSIEVCLNLAGNGSVAFNGQEVAFAPLTVGFYRRGEQPLRAVRRAEQWHQFLTVEMSFDFLRRHLGDFAPSLHPLVREVVAGQSEKSAVVTPTRLTSRQQQLLASLRDAPVLAAAQKLWYQTKALELAAELFFLAPGERELFCQRQQRLSAERVDKVVALLRENLESPPNLEEIGRAVGCSPFHLSRTFSAATGMTIPQYLRQLRMERAAELLRSGKFNVTEAALEVGYASLSHFSQAFHETFGCCPGLYPLRTPTQKTSLKQKE
ncbi:MAG TPA: AraC family transcriptional regulator [Candidatus Limnocylindrales bacterium]|nr:AraC family transcriptional regulator [Candidatus Limnocylindrales bacterium]